MKHIVLSGINLTDGGPLTIYKNILSEIVRLGYDKDNKITVFVYSKEEFKEYEENFELIEIKKSKKNWLNRLYYEYIYFNRYSKKENIDIWLSMHDITPNVKSLKRFVYCHNPSPFYRANLNEGVKLFLFTRFYKYLYKINITKNTNIIVQQDWIRNEFEKMYHVNNIIVARPDFEQITFNNVKDKSTENDKYTFIYAAFPRPFKNFEIICEACKILEEKNIFNYKVILTINGKENNYSKKILNKYKNLKTVKFEGIQKQKKLFDIYNKSNCMIFPSKLETWGLPITEYKKTNKPIILINLPYAHETIGKYEKTHFFEANNAQELATIMLNEINKKSIYTKTKENIIKQPYAKNWEELLKIIIGDN